MVTGHEMARISDWGRLVAGVGRGFVSTLRFGQTVPHPGAPDLKAELESRSAQGKVLHIALIARTSI